MNQLVQKDIILESLTSIKAGGKAAYYARPEDYDQLVGILSMVRSEGLELSILGGGTNTLISDKGIPGLLLDMRRFKTIHTRGTLLTARAGSTLERAVALSAEAGLSGLEYFSGLPGTVGGAVFGNAGCFHHEIGEVVEWVEYFDMDGELHKMWRDQYRFSYRSSPCRTNRWIITQIGFNLAPKAPIYIQQQAKAYRQKRREMGHYRYPSMGSIFKNPINPKTGMRVSAGELIDAAGLLGYTVGNAKVAEYHGNIIINPGGKAGSDDIFQLIGYIQDTVEKVHGITLELEINLLGQW